MRGGGVACNLIHPPSPSFQAKLVSKKGWNLMGGSVLCLWPGLIIGKWEGGGCCVYSDC